MDYVHMAKTISRSFQSLSSGILLLPVLPCLVENKIRIFLPFCNVLNLCYLPQQPIVFDKPLTLYKIQIFCYFTQVKLISTISNTYWTAQNIVICQHDEQSADAGGNHGTL